VNDFFQADGIELLWGVPFLRSVLAVVLGYAVFAVSGGLLFKVAGRDPHAAQDLWFVVLAVIYGMVFAGLGGVVAARLARAGGPVLGGWVRGLFALGATVSLLKSAGATWSQWSAILLMAPCACGAVHMRKPRTSG
jgi:hypothetical protein